MKKRIALLLPLCILLAATVWAVAAGDMDDPLVSLSYLTETFMKKLDREINDRLDESDEELLESSEAGESVVDIASTWQETRLKRGDMLLGSTGTNVLVLAGGAQVVYDGGAVVDVSEGTEVPSGAALVKGHRYMVAEDTAANFVVTTKTAVVDYQGIYDFSYSVETDYNAMAAALKRLNLFKGSFTGYGEGFDLEVSPTRLQALIMFIRVLGEEEQAMAWTGTTPFKDIEKGSTAEKYVGYAYSKGYTNGYSATQFKPAGAVNAYQYTEFVLRAMGYSSVANTNLADTLERAQQCGLLTFGEASMLQTAPFLRAELVYISYYALGAWMPDGSQTLADVLMDKGVFDYSAYRDAEKLVTGWRL